MGQPTPWECGPTSEPQIKVKKKTRECEHPQWGLNVVLNLWFFLTWQTMRLQQYLLSSTLNTLTLVVPCLCKPFSPAMRQNSFPMV